MISEKELTQKMDDAIEWIREYVKNSGARGVVVGNSGGKDSATVIAMSKEAIGKENVITVSMPCYSINQDFEDAKLVAKHFGVKLLNVDLCRSYKELEMELNKSIELTSFREISNEAKINIKPRLRMTALYAIAQSLGYLVIGTGNLSERMVGYTTKWGDSACDFNPIGNFTVNEVIEIGRKLGVYGAQVLSGVAYDSATKTYTIDNSDDFYWLERR